MSQPSAVLIRRIRILLALFIAALLLSGLTAIPLQSELNLATRLLPAQPRATSGLAHWLDTVHRGLVETNARFPFLAYGTDWLAFAHFVIAVAFVGPFRDPVRNIWVIEFGIIACLMVILFPFIMGPFRHIPLGWRIIDASFGFFGLIPLCFCRNFARQLSNQN